MSTDRQLLMAIAIGEMCCNLAAHEGRFTPDEIAEGLANMLGALIGRIDCCDGHRAEARDLAIRTIDARIATTVQVVAEDAFPAVEGHA